MIVTQGRGGAPFTAKGDIAAMSEPRPDPYRLSHYQVEAAGQVSDAEMAWNEHCRCVENSIDLDELKGSPADLLTGTPLSVLDLHGLGAGSLST
jgi:hypothetical protein